MKPRKVYHIELKLRSLDQLFNTMDPSPFHEKDLDDRAVEFITGWAEELHRHAPLDLIIHLEGPRTGKEKLQSVETAVNNFFAYRAGVNQLQFKRLMEQGRTSLLVGLAFLGLCHLLIELVVYSQPSGFSNFLTQSLTIGGWVAMWKPMEIYLYEWWPLRMKGKILEKLSRMQVHIRTGRYEE